MRSKKDWCRSLFWRACVVTILIVGGVCVSAVPQEDAPDISSPPALSLKKTVRRVVLDVTVTDADGKPVHGLTQKDFVIHEDHKKQRILSFDVHDLQSGADFAKLPPLPPNTFINVPSAPERGPLYVLLLDLVNTEIADQMYARQQLIKFIHDKPAGTRFAVFVMANGLHMVQGFTEDKNELFAAIDPSNPKPHIPRVFIYGRTYGKGSPLLTIHALKYIAEYLAGLPGRKNLIWFSADFPIKMYADSDDPPTEQRDLKEAIDALVAAEVSVFTIPNAGIKASEYDMPDSNVKFVYADWHGLEAPHLELVQMPNGPGMLTGPGMRFPDGFNLLNQGAIAAATGGHAFPGLNDVAGLLHDATELGANYYTLSYSPSNQAFDGSVRNIQVHIAKHHYQLAYRHFYYAEDVNSIAEPVKKHTPKLDEKKSARAIGDSLFANMEHGTPMAHEIYFRAHVFTTGAPTQATPEQMENLEDQPAYFRKRHKNRPLKPLPPVSLQTYVVDFTMMAKAGDRQNAKPPALEMAAAVFDEDGRMLNGIVENTVQDGAASSANTSGIYRAEEQLDVPQNAKSIRIAVRDRSTDRIGALEVPLPLAPEPASTGVTADKTAESGEKQ